MQTFNLGDPVTMTHYVKALKIGGEQIYVVVKHKVPLNGYWMGYREIGETGHTRVVENGQEQTINDKCHVELVVTSPRYNPNKAFTHHVRAGHHGV